MLGKAIKMQSLAVCLNLGCCQQNRGLYTQCEICKSPDNNKVKTYNKYRKENEKGI